MSIDITEKKYGQETVFVRKETVSCDGGGELGHPLVYLKVDYDGKVVCPYCDKSFQYTPDD